MMRAATASQGPWIEASTLAFRLLFAGTILGTMFWLGSNIQQVPSDSQAIVLRFGAMTRIQGPGLLLALPRPFEEVALVPSAAQVLQLRIQGLARDASGLDADPNYGAADTDAHAGSGLLMTGDAGAVHLDATLFYGVVDPERFLMERAHLKAALEQIFLASAIAVCATRDLDTILVARPELRSRATGADGDAAARREQLRADLMRMVNKRLGALGATGAGLGIKVSRIDIETSLPAATRSAFDLVLTTTQTADQMMADARTDAERIAQNAAQTVDLHLQTANAASIERVAKARADTATMTQLADAMHAPAGASLLLQLYRTRIAKILQQAGATVMVEPHGGSPLILSGPAK